jgi:hypothetical protein
VTTSYATLLSLIDEKFRLQAILKDKQWTFLHILDPAQEDVEDQSAASLEAEIEQEQAEIDRLESAISETAEEVLGSPLALVPLPRSDRPLVQHLEMARSKAAAGALDEARWECDRAMRLLSDPDRHPSDRGLVWLFRAGVSGQSGDYRNAQKWAERAYRYFPEADNLFRLVVCLIQLNSRAVAGIPKVVGCQTACRDALRRLDVLQETEAQVGNRRKVELYRTLKEIVERRSKELQNSDYPPRRWSFEVPPPFGRVRIISEDDIPMGEEEPVSDGGTEHIDVQQIDERGFEFVFEGRPLELEPLKGSRITFPEGYDYVAVRVSGDSMDQADICHNDYVILRRSQHVGPIPDDRDIVVAVFRDEYDDVKATLKRFRHHQASSKIILEPESSNPIHQPRDFPEEILSGDNSPVVGIAVAVLKPQQAP